MQFQVPQFIEVEDKIFGQLTLKQFLYLVGGAAMCFVAYQLLPLLLALPVIAIILVLSLALAFYKVNNKAFIGILESAVTYFFKEKLYIWKKQEPKPSERNSDTAGDAVSSLYVPRLADSKLKDMTWSLDVASSEMMNPVTHDKK